MSFNIKCSNLDRTTMRSRRAKKKTLHGTEEIVIPMHPCKAKDKFIDTCPEDCEFFTEE